jgi:carbonic anhydrase
VPGAGGEQRLTPSLHYGKLYYFLYESEGAMSVVEEVRSANESYAESFDKGSLPLPPGRKFAVLTCMDARIDPAKALGLEEGDAHVIRNAGGLASEDAVRSVVISQSLLGTEEVLVIGHTGCGMETFTNEDIRAKLRDERGADAEHIDFQPFPSVRERVQESVRLLKETPLLPDDYGVSGFVYDVETGRLEQVA